MPYRDSIENITLNILAEMKGEKLKLETAEAIVSSRAPSRLEQLAAVLLPSRKNAGLEDARTDYAIAKSRNLHLISRWALHRSITLAKDSQGSGELAVMLAEREKIEGFYYKVTELATLCGSVCDSLSFTMMECEEVISAELMHIISSVRRQDLTITVQNTQRCVGLLSRAIYQWDIVEKDLRACITLDTMTDLALELPLEMAGSMDAVSPKGVLEACRLAMARVQPIKRNLADLELRYLDEIAKLDAEMVEPLAIYKESAYSEIPKPLKLALELA